MRLKAGYYGILWLDAADWTELYRGSYISYRTWIFWACSPSDFALVVVPAKRAVMTETRAVDLDW